MVLGQNHVYLTIQPATRRRYFTYEEGVGQCRGWYLKHVSWLVFVGYVAGIVSYWLQNYIVKLLA